MSRADIDQGRRTVARTLRDALAHLSPVGATAVLRGQFPWIEGLSAQDVTTFVAEFTAAVEFAADRDDWTEFALTIEQWQESAQLQSDPELYELLTTPIDHDFGPAPDPHA